MKKNKEAAIALCKQRIEAAINLYGDGAIERDEYLRRVEANNREIAHWEARTTETERLATELALCVQAVDKIERLWDISSDEDRQGLVRSLFTEIIYDLDTQRIVSFKLKSWADRFLALRAALYENEASTDDPTALAQGMGNDVLHTGLYITGVPRLTESVLYLLWLLYQDQPLPQNEPISRKTPPKTDRNDEIRQLYAEGWSVPKLSKHFEISKPRIYQILKRTTG